MMKQYNIDGIIFKLEEMTGKWKLTIIDPIYKDGTVFKFYFKTKEKAMEEILSYAEIFE